MTTAEIKQSLNNPATGFWLKKAISELDNRDVLDAAIDADILLCFCKNKLKENGISYMEHSLSEKQ